MAVVEIFPLFVLSHFCCGFLPAARLWINLQVDSRVNHLIILTISLLMWSKSLLHPFISGERINVPEMGVNAAITPLNHAPDEMPFCYISCLLSHVHVAARLENP